MGRRMYVDPSNSQSELISLDENHESAPPVTI